VSLIFLLIAAVSTLSFKEVNISEREVSANLDLDTRIKFLLKQFSEKKLTIKEEYTMPFQDAHITPENLDALLKSILSHMKLKQNIFLVYHKKNERIYRGKAGTYDEASLGYKAINLVIDPKYVLEDYVSIIAHECSHHFMKEHNFKEMDELENEKNTDTLTVLLGFGRFLKVTHAKRYFFKGSNITVEGPTDYYETVQFGYLSQEEIEYISRRHLQILQTGKKQKRLKREEKDREVHRFRGLKSRIEKLKRELERNKVSLERILSTHNITEIATKGQLEKLSRLIYDYQGNTYESIINDLDNKVDMGYTHSSLIKEISELEEILRRDSFFIESHLIK